MSEDTADELKTMMQSVVSEGTGTWRRLGVDVAGKTGTAEIRTRGGGRRNQAWFIGFAPANDPQIAVAVIGRVHRRLRRRRRGPIRDGRRGDPARE